MNKIKYLIRQRRKHSKPSSALILNETFSNKTCLCSKLYDIPCSTDSLIIKQLLKHYSFYLLARLLLSNPPQVWIVLSSFWQGRPSCAAYFTHWPFFRYLPNIMTSFMPSNKWNWFQLHQTIQFIFCFFICNLKMTFICMSKEVL